MVTRLEGSRQLTTSDLRDTVDRIVRFIRTQAESSHAGKLIVGMSGGLDSSVTAALSSIAVGGRNVLGLALPEKETYDKADVDDARAVAKKYAIQFKVLDLTGLEQASIPLLGSTPKQLAWGNLKARLRMTILYFYANVNDGLVVGTGDKSELMLGYFTKYGDGACDFLPLGDLYKSSVRELAKHIRLPKSVSSKKPSPNLWPAQTAEKELGADYETIDRILWGFERWIPPREIAEELSVPISLVSRIQERWLKSEHKRRLPLTPKLGFRTVGMDFRLPLNRG